MTLRTCINCQTKVVVSAETGAIEHRVKDYICVSCRLEVADRYMELYRRARQTIAHIAELTESYDNGYDIVHAVRSVVNRTNEDF